jgi:hypothetical protein
MVEDSIVILINKRAGRTLSLPCQLSGGAMYGLKGGD